jgi:drug/metabolite transporter (DMT)-like permease
MRQNRPLLGISLMLAFCVLAPLLDVCSKLATQTVPVGQITAARFLVQGALMLPIALILGITWRVSLRDAGLLALRAVFLILSTFGFVAGVRVMPLADALAIVFIEPFILLILGHLIFGDHIGPRRIVASIVGFIGALFVIQPSITAFGTVALFPLLTAFTFAAYMLVTRAMSERVSPVAQQLHTSIAGSLIAVPVLALTNDSAIPHMDLIWPQGLAWAWLFGVGFWAAASHMCMTLALKYAPASSLAPIHYLEIIMAVGLGYLIFGDFPTPLTWVGIAVISASGLYIIHRERTQHSPNLSTLPPET